MIAAISACRGEEEEMPLEPAAKTRLELVRIKKPKPAAEESTDQDASVKMTMVPELELRRAHSLIASLLKSIQIAQARGRITLVLRGSFLKTRLQRCFQISHKIVAIRALDQGSLIVKSQAPVLRESIKCEGKLILANRSCQQRRILGQDQNR